MPKKAWQKVFPFRDKCISIGYLKLSLLCREYFWSAVNVLKSSPEILPIIKIDFSELNCLHSDHEIWQRWPHSDFSTVWSHLPCCLPKGNLKCDFLDIYLTTFLGIGFFGSTLAMRIIFLLKVFKILSTF